ncbi:MAG: DUF1127 domain-containing protein [Pseudomonadota bacterium]|nr:DUF1127 domain-containing protein [Pseudomonadota bacterium]
MMIRSSGQADARLNSGSTILLAVFAALDRWSSRAAQRRMLSGLSDYHLKDIGLTRADVEGEATKRFWQG